MRLHALAISANKLGYEGSELFLSSTCVNTRRCVWRFYRKREGCHKPGLRRLLRHAETLCALANRRSAISDSRKNHVAFSTTLLANAIGTRTVSGDSHANQQRDE